MSSRILVTGTVNPAAQKRVLYADDDEFVRLCYASQLRNLGAVVDEAADGGELVRMALRGEYDLIVTDNNMPKYTGLEAVRYIRGFDKDTPIYMVSSGDVAKEALSVGVDRFSSKPVPGREFVDNCLSLYAKSPRRSA